MRYVKPKIGYYRVAQAACWLVSKIIFRNKVLRNEIRGKKGPFVVIANHQTALDFVNLFCTTSRPMSFVISQSFFNTLPVKGYLKKIGVIPKQQFQTTVTDMKNMKAVIDHDQPLVIYPAGLMCEDGLSTPIPSATYKFLKWLGVDVYVARSYGSYFVMPKWTSGFRPGKTYIDIYKLISKEDLKKISLEDLKTITDDALFFDAYREQENNPQIYFHNNDLTGLQHVLYRCPHCGKEFTITVKEKATLLCSHCGYALTADRYGFLHNTAQIGQEIRYISDWSRWIFNTMRSEMKADPELTLSGRTKIKMINQAKAKFEEVGEGTLTLNASGFLLDGIVHNSQLRINLPVGSVPTLPFSPGKYLELQYGNDIYRCVLEDGKLVMKYINMVKILYELHAENITKGSTTSV